MTQKQTESSTPWGRLDTRFKQLSPMKRCLIVLIGGVTLGAIVFLWNYGGIILNNLTK